MGHLVLCLHHCDIKLRASGPATTTGALKSLRCSLFSLKIPVPQQLKSLATKESRSTGEVFIPRVTVAFCLPQEGVPWGWP